MGREAGRFSALFLKHYVGDVMLYDVMYVTPGVDCVLSFLGMPANKQWTVQPGVEQVHCLIV